MAYRDPAEVEPEPEDTASTALSRAERAAAEARRSYHLATLGAVVAILGAVLQLIAQAGKLGWF